MTPRNGTPGSMFASADLHHSTPTHVRFRRGSRCGPVNAAHGPTPVDLTLPDGHPPRIALISGLSTFAWVMVAVGVGIDFGTVCPLITLSMVCTAR